MAYTGGEGWYCGIGRCCFGIPTYVHWSFWAIAIIMMIFAAIRYKSWQAVLLIFLVYVPLLLLTILIHELGHIWRTRSFGGTCDRIMLWPLGGFSDCRIAGGTVMQEFWVAFCGPITHLPQLFFWWGIMAIASPIGGRYWSSLYSIYSLDNNGSGADIFFAELAKTMMVLNLMLLVINFFVPAYPLDGARMLAALSVQLGLYVKTAAYFVGLCGLILGLVLTVYGIIATIIGTGQGFFLLLIGIFCLITSCSLLYMTSLGVPHSHPLFAPDCYRNTWYGGNPSGGPTHSPHPVHRNGPPPENSNIRRSTRHPRANRPQSNRPPTKKVIKKKPAPQNDVEMGRPARSTRSNNPTSTRSSSAPKRPSSRASNDRRPSRPKSQRPPKESPF